MPLVRGNFRTRKKKIQKLLNLTFKVSANVFIVFSRRHASLLIGSSFVSGAHTNSLIVEIMLPFSKALLTEDNDSLASSLSTEIIVMSPPYCERACLLPANCYI